MTAILDPYAPTVEWEVCDSADAADFSLRPRDLALLLGTTVTVRVLRVYSDETAQVCMVAAPGVVWRVGVEELRVVLVREAE